MFPPACSSTHVTSQVLGQGGCWKLAFSKVKENHSVPSQRTEVVSEGRISLGYSPHLMHFLNRGHHQLRAFLQVDPQVYDFFLASSFPLSHRYLPQCCSCFAFLSMLSLRSCPPSFSECAHIYCLYVERSEEQGKAMIGNATTS